MRAEGTTDEVEQMTSAVALNKLELDSGCGLAIFSLPALAGSCSISRDRARGRVKRR